MGRCEDNETHERSRNKAGLVGRASARNKVGEANHLVKIAKK